MNLEDKRGSSKGKPVRLLLAGEVFEINGVSGAQLYMKVVRPPVYCRLPEEGDFNAVTLPGGHLCRVNKHALVQVLGATMVISHEE